MSPQGGLNTSPRKNLCLARALWKATGAFTLASSKALAEDCFNFLHLIAGRPRFRENGVRECLGVLLSDAVEGHTGKGETSETVFCCLSGGAEEEQQGTALPFTKPERSCMF